MPRELLRRWWPVGVALAVAAAAPVLHGCGAEQGAPTAAFQTTFAAQSDGTPLAGVHLTVDGHEVGTTGDDGQLTVDLRGREGSTVAVAASCPEGYREPEAVPPLRLHRFHGLGNDHSGLEVTVDCPPAERQVAVVVRTGDQGDIPILIHGREVARTSSAGIAHVWLRKPPATTFRLQLDTSGRPGLRPESPSMMFTVPDRDEVLVFDQPFSVERPRPRPRPHRHPPPAPRLPVRIGPQARWPGR